MSIGRDPGASLVNISIPKRSVDGRYWGRYPNGDKPASLEGPAQIDVAVQGALGTKTQLRGTPSVGAAGSGVLIGGSTRGPIKFTPGHWVLLASGSGGGGLGGWITRINQIAAINTAAGFMVFVGVLFPYDWNGLEFAEGVYTQGSGVSAQGLAQVAQLVTACAAVGLKCGIEYEDRTFFGHTYTTPTPSIVNLPSYFQTLAPGGGKGYYIAASGQDPGGLGGIALEDQSYVLARHIALAKGYATTPLPDGSTLETNPTFEMWRGPETAIDGSAGISNSNWQANLKLWNAALRASNCWATTEFSISTNFLSNALMQDYFLSCKTYAAAVGGPDNNIPYAGNTGDGDTTAASVYRGSAGTVWNNILLWISESQFPDSAGQNYHAPRTCVDVWNFWMNNVSAYNPAPTWGGVQPHKFVWDDNTGSTGITISQVATAIKAGQMPTNTQRPSSYL